MLQNNFLIQLLDIGGPIIPALMFVCLLLWTLIIERYWFLYADYHAIKQQIIQRWQLYHASSSWAANSTRELLLSQNKTLLETRLSSIRLLIKLCPLLGLLGTVTGMINVFDVIALTGNSDAKAMAAGIYHATLPTMAGLLLALSALYCSHQISHKVQQLQEQLGYLLNAKELAA